MKRLLIFLAILSGVALVWAAPPADKLPPLIGPPEALARITTVVVGGSPPSSGGPPAGTILLGTNNTGTSTADFTGNANTAYYMCHTGQATATATTAYFYDLGYETPALHVCVWSSGGTLLGCSGDITPTASAGWRSASISVSITESTSYAIGMVGQGTGIYGKYDESSPALPAGLADNTGVTYGSEGAITVETCDALNGSYLIYITN